MLRRLLLVLVLFANSPAFANRLTERWALYAGDTAKCCSTLNIQSKVGRADDSVQRISRRTAIAFPMSYAVIAASVLAALVTQYSPISPMMAAVGIAMFLPGI